MPMFKKSLVALLFIAIAVLGGTIYGNYNSDDVTQLDAATVNKTDDEDEEEENSSIFVYVTGAVNKPGMVEIENKKGGIRAAEAVEKCGGLLPTADVNNFNMAEVITDGQHIRVPEKNVESSPNESQNVSNENVIASNSNNSKSISSNKKTTSAGGVVNINTANSEELQTLNGIGPKMAEKIIEYRQNNGSFKSIEEIKNVRGIGDKKFEKLREHIRI